MSVRWRGEIASAELHAKLDRLVERSARRIEAGAKRKAPFDTGHLRNSIGAFMEGPLHWKVVAGASYSADVEYGTAAHEIRPRSKKALFWKGADHPVAKVHHPGTPPQPFLTPALEEERPRFLSDAARL